MTLRKDIDLAARDSLHVVFTVGFQDPTLVSLRKGGTWAEVYGKEKGREEKKEKWGRR